MYDPHLTRAADTLAPLGSRRGGTVRHRNQFDGAGGLGELARSPHRRLGERATRMAQEGDHARAPVGEIDARQRRRQHAPQRRRRHLAAARRHEGTEIGHCADRTRADRCWSDTRGVIGHLTRMVRADRNSAHGELRSRLATILYVTIVFDVVMTALVLVFEHGTAVIDNPWDAFFWATTQLLTVSSQLPLPTTDGGRVVDIVLQVYAITVVASLAGTFSHFLRRHSDEAEATT